jgi:hypothetical protein
LLELSSRDAYYWNGVRMKTSNSAKKEFEDIHKEIGQLKLKEKKLMRDKDMVFCPICQKLYNSENYRQGPEMSGPILEAWLVTCPKGHTWDDK